MILEHINKVKCEYYKETGKEPNTLFLGTINFHLLLEELESTLIYKGKTKVNCIVYGLEVKVLDKNYHFQIERILDDYSENSMCPVG